MDERIEFGIAKVLNELGYTNVAHNFGTVWYDDEYGNTHSIGDTFCE